MRISWKTVVAYSSKCSSSGRQMADFKLLPYITGRFFSEGRIGDMPDGGSAGNVRGAPKRLTAGFGKTAGRNSSGRITSFHRGGGAKRLQRKVDLKRNVPSVGIIQRIDYDPNRSSRLALVRWVDDAQPADEMMAQPFSGPLAACLALDASATTIAGKVPLSSICGKVDERKVPCFSRKPQAKTLMVGVDTRNLPVHSGSRMEYTNTRNVFLSAFSSKGKQNKSSPSIVPRIAVAGAKPSFTATENAGESVRKYDLKKWDLNSTYWGHRIKRKAALPWKNFYL